MMRTPLFSGRSRAVALLVAAALASGAIPAQADKRADTGNAANTDMSDPGSLAAAPQLYDDSVGGINPTNIAVVSTDLTCVVAPPEVQIQSAAANLIATGRGVVVAVLDGGFNLRQPDIAAHISSDRYDAIGNDQDPNDLGNRIDDDHDGIVDRGVGHGTFVIGMVLKAAPNATIVPIRVRDDEGWGIDLAVNRGLSYAISRKVNIINLSLEMNDATNPMLSALFDSAKRAGITVVVSAGNSGQPQLSSTAFNASTCAVGAVDAFDRIAPFSNYADTEPCIGGARVVFAPGVDLYGPIGTPTFDARGYWSGTSFSAGLVSGAAAVLLERHPGMLPRQVGDLLGTTADPVRNAAGATLLHAGRINVLRAVTK